MTPDQKSIVKMTWQKVIPIADTASELFYHRMFQLDPALRELFVETDMAAQRVKMLQTLGAAIRGLDDFDTLLPVIEEMGRRHAEYGVEDRHYETVGDALIWTLEQGLGSAWSPEVAEAWRAFYAMLSEAMQTAADKESAAA